MGAEKTWGEVAWSELRQTGEAQGFDAAQLEGWGEIYRDIASPCAWWSRAVGAPALPSGVSHGRPFSTSLPVSKGEPELRFFFEAQSDPPSPEGYWSTGWDISRAMRRHGADLERLDAIAEHFAPSAPRTPFRVWHGGAFRAGAPPLFKIYLCPAAHGPEHALGHLRDALSQLDMAPALDAVLPVMRPGDTISTVSLDLSSADDARLKLYLLQRDAHLDHMTRAATLGTADPAQASAEVRDVALTLIPNCDETPLWWLSCHHFALGQPDAPLYTAAHIGVARQKVDDALVEQRLTQLCHAHGLDASAYLQARQTLPALAASHHVISWQRPHGADPKLVVYFATRTER